jgi:DNA-binding SARP family transcriptional activator
VRVHLFGPLEVLHGDGTVIDVPGARVRMLLARLAVDCGRSVGRDALIAAVWPQAAPAGAVNALQALVARLRRAPPDAVRSTPSGYRLDMSIVDIVEFEELVAAGEAERALALWRGEPFAELDASPFIVDASAHLGELRARALSALVDDELAAGRLGDERLAQLSELAAARPLREPVQALLMRALVAAGRPAEALAV